MTARAPILLHGATGFTGRLVAGELLGRGVPFAVSGRDEEKLRQVAEDNGAAEICVVDSANVDAVREAVIGRTLVASCAGPFAQVGEPIVRACAEAGVHYVDTTGEQSFVARIHRELAATAVASGACLTPAMAYDRHAQERRRRHGQRRDLAVGGEEARSRAVGGDRPLLHHGRAACAHRAGDELLQPGSVPHAGAHRRAHLAHLHGDRRGDRRAGAPHPDLPAALIPLLRRSAGITIGILDPSGTVGMLRPNHLQPPFDNPAIRRAFLGAIDQTAMMQAIVGDEPSRYHVPLGFFTPGTPMASDAGLSVFSAPRDLPKVAAEIKAAGYKGETTVLIVPSDYEHMRMMGEVVADTMRKVGLNVDYVATDWATMLQRRNNKGPADKGGWSGFITSWTGSDWLNPATHLAIRGNGEAGYPGWSTSPRTEQLYKDWFAAPDEAARAAICRQMQLVCLEDVPYYPLGQFEQDTAYRGITDVNKGFATFWSVRPK